MAHTLGNPFDLGAALAFCQKHDLWLIEDNCERPRLHLRDARRAGEILGLDHLLKIAETGAHPFIRFEQDPSQPTTNNQQPLLVAPTGSWGDLSTQSFYPPHHLTMGEGGAVSIIRRPPLKTYAESFRDWGRDCWCPSGKDNTCNKRFGWQLGELPEGYDHKYIYSHLGFNLKPLDPQAAIGRQQLKKLPAFIEARKQNWETLRRGLADLDEYFQFSLPTHATGWAAPTKSGKLKLRNWEIFQHLSISAFRIFLGLHRPPHRLFVVRFHASRASRRAVHAYRAGPSPRREENRQPHALRRQPPQAARLRAASQGSAKRDPHALGSYPGADEIMHTALFLGTYPGLTPAMLDYEIETIKNFVRSF